MNNQPNGFNPNNQTGYPNQPVSGDPNNQTVYPNQPMSGDPNQTVYPNQTMNGDPNQTVYPNQTMNGVPNNGGMPPKKNNNLIIGVIAVAAVLILAIVIVVAFNMGKGQSVGGGMNGGPGPQPQQQAMVEEEPEEDSKPSTSSSKSNGAQKPASGKYSRQNPAPVGVAQTLVYEDEFDEEDNFTATVKIIETIRGEDALAMIKEVNQFNDDPKEGYEYVLAKVSITLDAINSEKAFDANAFDFDSFTSSNEELEWVSVIEPDPELDGKLYEGASTEGWITVQVKADDMNPKVAYKLEYDGTGGLWFALQ